MNKSKKNPLGLIIGLLVVIALGWWCGSCLGTEGVTITSAIKVSTTVALLASIFIVSALGYLLGSVSVKGVSLGTAGVFLVAILFGYLCALPGLQEIPLLNTFYMADNSAKLCGYFKTVIQNVGLVLFVTSVGFIAGPSFFKNLKKNATSFVLLGAVIILTGAAVAVVFALIPGVGPEFSAGILSGALTTTPGYSAALEAAVDSKDSLVTLGHAIAYPFGVIGVVLFVQLLPKFLKADMAKERELLRAGAEEKIEEKTGLFACDPFGLTPFALAVVFGLLLGAITIPLTGSGYKGACFSLGTTGGTLIMSLIFGHFGHFGKLSLKVSEGTAKVLRELGLMLFLIGAGIDGGVSLVSEISKSGGQIVVKGLIGGACMTLIPMIIGFLVAKYLLKLNLLNSLGSITGGMTSTPALGTLISTAGTDDVAAAYASTYPIALVLIVLASQLIITLMG